MDTFKIRFLIIATLSATTSLTCTAQHRPRVYLGITGDTHLSWLVKEYWFEEQTPMPGWGVGLVGMIDLRPSLTLTAGMGANRDEMTQIVSGHGFDVSQVHKYAWAEISAGALYKPIHQTSFALLLGCDLSARHLLAASFSNKSTTWSGRVISEEHSLNTEVYYRWNYFFTPRLGAEFGVARHGRLQFFVEYNFGLRYVDKRPDIEPCNTCDIITLHNGDFLHSVGVSTAWLWGFAARQ